MRNRGSAMEAYFRRSNQGRLIHRWMHDFDIYERRFSPYRKQLLSVDEHSKTIRRMHGYDTIIVSDRAEGPTQEKTRPAGLVLVGELGA